jgi:hypothetical protein
MYLIKSLVWALENPTQIVGLIWYINVKEERKGQLTFDNPEKRATLGTQDTRRRQTKQKHNIICVCNICMYDLLWKCIVY